MTMRTLSDALLLIAGGCCACAVPGAWFYATSPWAGWVNVGILAACVGLSAALWLAEDTW